MVFNTPGANANAVKELTVCALLLASRDIVEGSVWTGTLEGNELGVAKAVEKGKSSFAGCEILGKTLGVMGFGAIGRLVADAAKALGMNVIAYDAFPVKDPAVPMCETPDELLSAADYITLHIPSLPSTKGFLNAANIAKMKDGVKIINLARGDLAVNADLKAALASGKVKKYVTDFPSEELIGQKGIVCIPHLGASTEEAEDNWRRDGGGRAEGLSGKRKHPQQRELSRPDGGKKGREADLPALLCRNVGGERGEGSRRLPLLA